MCIGFPMQVVAGDGEGMYAVCEGRGERKRLDMRLVGEQPPGTWVLEFLGAARHVMSDAEAHQTLAGIEALDLALRGHAAADMDHLFADLLDREPQLPEHLRPATPGSPS